MQPQKHSDEIVCDCFLCELGRLWLYLINKNTTLATCSHTLKPFHVWFFCSGQALRLLWGVKCYAIKDAIAEGEATE